MACALTQGYTLDCRDSIGGSKDFHIIEYGNATFTITSDVVTAVANASTKQWRKYEQIKETSSATETFQDNVQNGTSYYQQEISLVLNKRQTATRNEIQLLGQNRLWIIEGDRNGKYWLYGYENGMDRNGGSGTSGVAMADRNGYTLNFMGMEPDMAIEVNPSVIAGLVTPGA